MDASGKRKSLLLYPDLPNGKDIVSQMIRNGTPFDWDSILECPTDTATCTTTTTREPAKKRRKKEASWDDDDDDSIDGESDDADF